MASRHIHMFIASLKIRLDFLRRDELSCGRFGSLSIPAKAPVGGIPFNVIHVFTDVLV